MTSLRFALITLIFLNALSSQGGEIALELRDQTQSGEKWQKQTRKESWNPSETAVVICDMWDAHHCRNATIRVGEIAPRMNSLVSNLRDRGVFVIHAPSSCLEFYKDHPARKRAAESPQAENLPDDIASWCKVIPGEDMEQYPIDQSDGGEDDDPDLHFAWANHLKSKGRNPKAPWSRQIETIQIDPERDIISDRGVEIWNCLEARGIKNVLLVGVHTNMCVLGRPFGLRQMSKNGKNVALVRDMTDTMYNPKMRPFVSHYRGTELIIDHIERYVASTVTSDQIIGGKPFRFAWDVPTRIVIATAEPGYGTEETLPALAEKIWTKERGYEVTVIRGDPKSHDWPGFGKAMKNADILVLSVRRQALPREQINAIRDHLNEGKSLLAIRTTSHGFDARGKGPPGNDEWANFGEEILGAVYLDHLAHDRSAEYFSAKDDDPLLSGVELPFVSTGGIYRFTPSPRITPALKARIDGVATEPAAWTSRYGKKQARVFYTSLGHKKDFENPSFQKLLWNAMEWLRVLPSDLPNPEGF